MKGYIIARLNNELEDCDWDQLYELDDPNKIWDFILNQYNVTLDKIASEKNMNNVCSKEVWITKDAISLIHYKRNLV